MAKPEYFKLGTSFRELRSKINEIIDALPVDVANMDDYYLKTETYSRVEIENILSDYVKDSVLDNYYTKSESYSKTEVDEKLDEYVENTDLDDYYTKTETNKALEEYAKRTDLANYYTKSDVYTKTESDTKLNSKLTDYYKKAETYSQAEVNAKLTDYATLDNLDTTNKAVSENATAIANVDDKADAISAEVVGIKSTVATQATDIQNIKNTDTEQTAKIGILEQNLNTVTDTSNGNATDIANIKSGSTQVGSAKTADSATKATNDGDGNKIADTYVKKAGTNAITANNTYSGKNVFTNGLFEIKAKTVNDDSWIQLTNSGNGAYYAFGIHRPYKTYGLQLKYHPDASNQDTSRPGAADGTSDIYYNIYHQGNLTKNVITGLGIPAQDTTYNKVSTTADGLAPKITNINGFLKGDGTWHSLTKDELVTLLQEATESSAGVMSAQDKKNLDTLIGLLGTGDDTNTVVDTLREILAIFDQYPEGSTLVSVLAEKVDKQDGYGLYPTANPVYTATEKTKLAGIETGANKTVVDTALSDTSTNPVQNKVVKDKFDEIETSISAIESDIASLEDAIDEANSTANTAKSTANDAKTSATNAVNTANTANTNATNAVNTANTANETANSAKELATTASNNASAAVTTADSAYNTATTAKATADTAKSTADTAKSTADSAKASLANYLPLSGGTMKNGATLSLLMYSQRYLNITGNGMSFDMSAVTGGWAGNFVGIKDPAGDTTPMLGYYGGGSGLTHIFMGGTYSDPFMKMTKAGQFTFKNLPTLGTADIGSATQPVWLDNGVLKACTYTLGKSVPSDAVFVNYPPLQKLTYEESKELACGSNGKVCIGKFGAYDSNITIDIDSTTSTTYHATIVIHSQNVASNSTAGTVGCYVYGDADNHITPLISVFRPYGSASRQIEVYANLPGWSKNLVHVRAVALSTGGMTDVLTSVDAIPTEIEGKTKVTPVNVLTTAFQPKGDYQPSGDYVTVADEQTISGQKTFSSFIKTAENKMGVKIRTHDNYEGGFVYGTTGNEAFTLAMQNPVTAFQIVYGTKPSTYTGSTWQSVTPLFQTKDGKVIINRKITATAETTNLKLFDVNGTIAGTEIFENGTSLASKYQAKGNYQPAGNYLTGITKQNVTDALGYTPPTKDETMSNLLYDVDGSSSTTEGTWLGTNSQITALTDMLAVKYKVAVAGASTTTFNLNGLGAKTVYMRGTTKVTTNYGVGTVITMIYNATTDAWYTADYDANSYAYARQYGNVSTNAAYPVLFSYSSSLPSTYKNNYTSSNANLTFNPSTKVFNAYSIEENGTALSSKYVAQVSGKALSTNDFTNDYKTKLDGIETGANNFSLPSRLNSYHTSNNLNATESGWYYSNAMPSSLGLGSNQAYLYTAAYGSTWASQIAIGCYTDKMAFRRNENGVWKNWKTVATTDDLPTTASPSVLGLVKTGYTTSGKNYAVQVDSSGNAYVNVPWSDTNTQRTNTEIVNLIYPVGSIYMSVNSTSPATLFGGTWEQLKDRFLIGTGDSYSNGATGGSATDSVTLSSSNLPAHTHTIGSTTASQGSHSHDVYTYIKSGGAVGIGKDYGTSGNRLMTNTDETRTTTTSLSYSGSTTPAITVTAPTKTGSTGSTTAFSVDTMPPYLAVYMWKRTA